MVDYIAAGYTWATGNTITATRLNDNVTCFVTGLSGGTKSINVGEILIGSASVINSSYEIGGLTKATIDNLILNGNDISSSSGNLTLTPFAGSSAIIDSHFGFDGTTLTALTDNNTTINAYTGKNVTIEGMTIDGGVVAGITSLTATTLNGALGTASQTAITSVGTLTGLTVDDEIIVKETTSATPPAGYQSIYPKADGYWYTKDDAGTESRLQTGSDSDVCELNFSIDQKEDTEDSEYDNQIKAQTIPYGSKFTSVTADSERLHRLEVVNVPAASHEVTYTGSWSNNDSASHLYGRGKSTTTPTDTAVLAFTGTSVSIAVLTSTDKGYFTAEIAPVTNGVVGTYGKKITITQDAGAAVYNTVYNLYSGLTFGDYSVKITLVLTNIIIGYFSYQTYMVQKPITQYEVYNASYATTVDMVPPTTSFLNGTWTYKNYSETNYWNSTAHSSNTASDSIEFKFYGKYLWVNIDWLTTANINVSVLIDGVTTNVKSTTFNADTPYNRMGAWVRLDNGQLTDGTHTVKLTRDSAAATEYMGIFAFGWYSAKADSTLCHDLILGESSYVVGVDDAGFAFTGAGWGAVADDSSKFLRRWKSTSTNTDYFTFTTPNNSNLKAVYAVMTQHTDRGRVKITLGASNTRYLNNDTNNYTLGDTILCLYDSTVDGITLHNKQLKVEKIDGTTMDIQGLIFEIWGTDKIGTNSIKVMQKWSRYNASTNLNTPVSNSYRFSVSGLGKTGQDALPVVHSGWIYGNSGAVYSNMGVMRDEIVSNTNYSNSLPIISSATANSSGLTASARPEIQYKTSAATSWNKFVVQLKRTI